MAIDWLDESAINQSLISLPIPTHCVIMDSLPSTNQWLAEHANHPSPLLVCACEQQTQGKGRSGKHWHSRMAKDLTVSLRWEVPKQHQKETVTLSLMTAVVLAEWVNSLSPSRNCLLKWPNDLLIQDQKLAGILLEQINSRQVIIGIGVNVAAFDDTEHAHIQQPATSLEEIIHNKPNRTSLLTSLIAAINEGLHRFQQDGFAPFYERWTRHDALLNQRIIHTLGNKATIGIARGISEKGELILELDDGTEQAIFSGTVRLFISSKLPNDGNE